MKIGAIDIGTNSMRLLIADYVEGEFFNRQKYINTTRIGQGVDEEGFIRKEALDRNVKALEEFVKLGRKQGCENIYVIGTSALRDSKNKAEFLEKSRDIAQIDVKIISGEEEANLGFLGVCQGIKEEGDILVIDIGGGSTEFIVGEKKNGISFLKSEDVGALRMTEKFLKSDLVKEKEFKTLQDHVKNTIFKTLEKIKKLNIKKVVGIGGTITSLSAMAQGLAVYDMNKIHNSTLSLNKIEEMLQNLKELTVEEKKKMKGLQPKRADIITAGVGILQIIMKSLNLEEIIISEFDNLEGLICKKCQNTKNMS